MINEVYSQLLFYCTQLVLDITEYIFQRMLDQSEFTIPFFKQFGSWDQLCPNFTLSNLGIKLRHLKDG